MNIPSAIAFKSHVLYPSCMDGATAVSHAKFLGLGVQILAFNFFPEFILKFKLSKEFEHQQE